MPKHIEISISAFEPEILSAARLLWGMISDVPLRHPILAYLTLASPNGLDDDEVSKRSVPHRKRPDLIISGKYRIRV